MFSGDERCVYPSLSRPSSPEAGRNIIEAAWQQLQTCHFKARCSKQFVSISVNQILFSWLLIYHFVYKISENSKNQYPSQVSRAQVDVMYSIPLVLLTNSLNSSEKNHQIFTFEKWTFWHQRWCKNIFSLDSTDSFSVISIN